MYECIDLQMYSNSIAVYIFSGSISSITDCVLGSHKAEYINV